jgi:hypothetical protein
MQKHIAVHVLIKAYTMEPLSGLIQSGQTVPFNAVLSMHSHFLISPIYQVLHCLLLT